jgi:hypothetical protein
MLAPKKTPGDAGGFSTDMQLLAALTAAGSSRATGTGAGTSPSTQGHGRGNRKSGTGAGIDEIDLYLTAVGDQPFVHQKINSIDSVGFIIFFRLIQSQAQ